MNKIKGYYEAYNYKKMIAFFHDAKLIKKTENLRFWKVENKLKNLIIPNS